MLRVLLLFLVFLVWLMLPVSRAAEADVPIFFPILRTSENPPIRVIPADEDDPFRLTTATSLQFVNEHGVFRCIVGELVHVSTGFHTASVRMTLDSIIRVGSQSTPVVQEATVPTILQQGGNGDVLPFRHCFDERGTPQRITLQWSSKKALVPGRYCRLAVVSPQLVQEGKGGVTGTIRNDTGIEQRDLRVAVVLRSGSGSVLDVLVGTMKYPEEGQHSLRPGEDAPFTTEPTHEGMADRIDVYTEGDSICP